MQECYDCGNSVTNAKAIPFLTKIGKLFKCPVCFEVEPKLEIKQRCEVYSRVCGYMRPVSNWNSAKQQEFKQRKVYRLNQVE